MSKEKKVFEQIWHERPHVSFLSGKPISEAMAINFAHVLPKGKWHKMKTNPENIILLTAEEHRLLDFGSIEQREEYAKREGCDWGVIDELKEKLKQQYK